MIDGITQFPFTTLQYLLWSLKIQLRTLPIYLDCFFLFSKAISPFLYPRIGMKRIFFRIISLMFLYIGCGLYTYCVNMLDFSKLIIVNLDLFFFGFHHFFHSKFTHVKSVDRMASNHEVIGSIPLWPPIPY